MFLILFSAPTSLRQFLFAPMVDDGLPQALVSLLTEVVHPLPASTPFEAREKLRVAGERRRALLLFRHGFPPEISKPVGRIPVEQWRILRLLRREQAMLDLLPVNPALVFAVAVALRGSMGSRLPPGFAKMRQSELAHDLGFPDSEAVVRVLRKVPSETLGEERLNRSVSESTNELVEQWLRDWSLSEVRLPDPGRCGAR